MLRSRSWFFISTVLLSVKISGGYAQTAGIIPFESFYRNLSQSNFLTQKANPTSKVQDFSSFEEMRNHLINIYSAITVKHSFVVESAIFDCVPIMEQPGVRLQGITKLAEPPPAPLAEGMLPNKAEQAQRDSFGNVIACESGTIPMRRVTLDDISRFKNLQEFFQKGPDGAGRAPISGSAKPGQHLHSVGITRVKNIGGFGYIEIWNPLVQTKKSHIFSLSQLWSINDNGPVQSVEAGWQNYPQLYNTFKSVPFVYWTASGYQGSRPGCYNLTCPGFVQTDNSVKLGAPFGGYSSLTGPKYSIVTGTTFYKGNWFVYMTFFESSKMISPNKIITVGYYPGSLYRGTPMAHGPNRLDFGGETVGQSNWPPMGNGRMPAAPDDYKTGYINYLLSVTSPGKGVNARLQVVNESPKCYQGMFYENSARSSLTFGGSGGAC